MRILHTMLRVGDLQRSINFYTQVMGMQLLRTTDRPEQKYSLAFVGYGDERQGAVLELTCNHGVTHCERIKAAGGTVTREAGPVKGGSTVIAFVQDPDGYKIELIQTSH